MALKKKKHLLVPREWKLIFLQSIQYTNIMTYENRKNTDTCNHWCFVGQTFMKYLGLLQNHFANNALLLFFWI